MNSIARIRVVHVIAGMLLAGFLAVGCDVEEGPDRDIHSWDGLPDSLQDPGEQPFQDVPVRFDHGYEFPDDNPEPSDLATWEDQSPDVPITTCLVGAPCDDDPLCPDDNCDFRPDCAHELVPGWCFTGDSCVADGRALPGAPCMTCQTAIATDRLFPDDTRSCDDRDMCTDNDRCSNGVCLGTPLACDDGNPCTQDRCEPGSGCVHVPMPGPCNDGNLCTEDDACVDGQCTGRSVACDDGNPCTNGYCLPEAGCIQEPNDDSCDNGNACTEGDICRGGRCIAGAIIDCDDGHPCTNDSCVPTRGCVHIPNTDRCDDGNPCTINDECLAGRCEPGSQILDCDDGNLCTDDTCDPVAGCSYRFNAGPCDDGDPCSIGDTCGGGSCLPGVLPLGCNDGNPCTSNACEPGIGCTASAREGNCDDGDPCTLGDSCREGECIPGTDSPDCDDGDRCTLDSCRPGFGCESVPAISDETCGIEVLIHAPERAATLTGDPEVVVQGEVRSLAGWPLAGINLEIDGLLHPLILDDQGLFQVTARSSHGMNLIELSATDVHGSGAATSRSWYYSREWLPPDDPSGAQPAHLVPGGLKAFMSESAIDDVDPMVPDIAAMLQQFLPLIDPMAFLSNPLASGTMGDCVYNLHVFSLNFAGAQVNLLPWDHEFIVDITLEDLTGLVTLEMDGGEGCQGLDQAMLTASSIQVAFRLAAQVESPGVVKVELPFRNAWISPDLALSPCEPYCEMVGFMGPVLESRIKTMLTTELVPVLESALAERHSEVVQIPPLAAGFPPAPVRLDAQVSRLDVQPSGIHAHGDEGFLVSAAAPRETLGSILRGSCGDEASFQWILPAESPIEIGVGDDLLNRAMFAMWGGGSLDGTLTGETLAALGADTGKYGISNLTLDLAPLLPPVMTDCKSTAGVLFEIGDLEVLASFRFAGLDVVARLWLSARIPADIAPVLSDDGELRVALVLGEPRQMKFDVGETGGSPGVGRNLVTYLMALLLEEAMPRIAEASFMIPDLAADLSTLSNLFPPGTDVFLDLDRVRRIAGATVLGVRGCDFIGDRSERVDAPGGQGAGVHNRLSLSGDK